MIASTELLAVELLASPDERRSSDLPEARRDHLPELVHTFDLIDYEVAADPIVDRAPRRCGSKKTASLLAILDNIQEKGCGHE